MSLALRMLALTAADAFKLIQASCDPSVFIGHVVAATFEQLTALRSALAEIMVPTWWASGETLGVQGPLCALRAALTVHEPYGFLHARDESERRCPPEHRAGS